MIIYVQTTQRMTRFFALESKFCRVVFGVCSGTTAVDGEAGVD